MGSHEATICTPVQHVDHAGIAQLSRVDRRIDFSRRGLVANFFKRGIAEIPTRRAAADLLCAFVGLSKEGVGSGLFSTRILFA